MSTMHDEPDATSDEHAAIAGAVEDVLGGTGWTVAPLAGTSGRTFLATGPDTVVVRFDASPLVLGRVAELGIGPQVLAAGESRGRVVVFLEHVDAAPASAAWLAAHADGVALLVATYARDDRLAALAEPLTARAYAADLLARARAAGLTNARQRGVEQLADTVPPDAIPAVASHGDPNSSNFLAGDPLLLVDWDDLRRADPLRDLGQLAWWYLPESAWRGFLEAAGCPWEADTRDRLFWWVAAESLDVALRLVGHDQAAAEAFLVDFEAAVERRPNPRRG